MQWHAGTELGLSLAFRVTVKLIVIVICKLQILICLHAKHLGILTNSLKRVRAFQIELEFGLKC